MVCGQTVPTKDEKKATGRVTNGTPPPTKDVLNSISFGFHPKYHPLCPIEVCVIDPLGRKMGTDPIARKKYDEIPRSAEGGSVGGGNPDDKFLDVIGAVNGDYLVTVVGTGKLASKYAMEISAENDQSKEVEVLIENINIGQHVVNKYILHYDSKNMKKTQLSGGFDGGGQRPKDVNKFLSYANPSDSQTDLPARTTTFPMMIFYGNSIVSGSFKATLNGADVTSLFNPIPGNHETVNINLSPGRNVLLLSADGNLPSRLATDTDRLVFIVK